MTIEVMKQALEALGLLVEERSSEAIDDGYAAITALRTAIEQAEKQEAWKTSDTAYRPGGLPQDVQAEEPVAYLCENAVGHKYFRWKKPSSTYKPISLYTTPPRTAIEQSEKQGPVCDKDPRGCWSVRCQLGNKCKNTPAAQRQPHEWIAVDECMPEPGAYVLAVFRYTTGKQRVIRAMHAPQKTLSEDDYGEFVTEGADYDEATDTTYWPEGWYECNENEETHWQVHEEVTHWMPLPAAPSVGEKPDAA